MPARSLLVSDVDGTLLGDDAALAEFAAWFADCRDALHLAYSSGRFCDSVVESIRSTALPQPDVIIGGVGTEIRLFPSGQMLDQWQQSFERWDAVVVRREMARFEQLEFQPQHQQSDYKVSYYGYDLSVDRLQQIEQTLRGAGVRAKLVYSSRRDLDVLPAGADKGAAAAFLASYLKKPAHRVMVSGDSGNDLAMFQQGFRGIVVANAHPELKALPGPEVYQAQRPFAAGVREGVCYWWQQNRQEQQA